jgi:hypothetical protein
LAGARIEMVGRGPMTDHDGQPQPVEALWASACRLESDDPGLVARAAVELRTAADHDHAAGVPRGKAYVRRLQELLVEQPELGIAVARSLGLEHIAEDLLSGLTLEGVAGIGPDGSALPQTPRQRTRRRGKLTLAISAVALLVEAVVADGLPSILLYVWTAFGLGLFFVGCYLVMLRE